MSRLRFQSKKVVYDVRSKIKFSSGRVITYKTYYGASREIGNAVILRRARANIEKKLEESSGRIMFLEVVGRYM